jgi:hypothetical protein
VEQLCITESNIQHALNNPFGPEEELFAQVGINIAAEVGLFEAKDKIASMEVDRKPVAVKATMTDISRYRQWEAIIKKIAEKDNEGVVLDRSCEIWPSTGSCLRNVEPQVAKMVEEDVEDHTYLNSLYREQRIAHDIVINHLDAELADRNPPQLFMIIISKGGSGKSSLINAITTSFERRKASHLLAKTATSGVAASLIGGTTLHWWGGIPAWGKLPEGNEWMNRSSKAVKARRETNISKPSWLAIDEAGMLTKDMLTFLSQVTGLVRTGNGRTDSTVALGGINTILIADFHQFPPIAHENVALYRRETPRESSIIGDNIYHQFDTVVELTQQKRIEDERWNEILNHSCTGSCTRQDLNDIRKLVLTDDRCDIPDFSTLPWSETVLVTPRNSVRDAWNKAKVREHCNRTGNALYVVGAEDSGGKERRALTNTERLTIARMSSKQTAQLENRIELAVGMKVMVTLNTATDIGLANGSRGTIVDIVLDPRESNTSPDEDDEHIIHLDFPPAMIVFEPARQFDFEPFDGLQPGQIPIFPKEASFRIGTKKRGTSVNRRQLPLTPAYAFTDRKAQGQTLGNVLVDIGRLSRFPVNQFAAYVALSRGKGRHKIRLLRDFDDNLFTKHPSLDLKFEDGRLEGLIQQTKENWEAGRYNF